MPEEKPKDTGAEMFAPKPKKEEQPSVDVAAQVTNLSRAIKLLEDKSSNLRKKVQVNEENSLAAHKKTFDEMKVIKSDILEIKRDIDDVKDKIRLIIRELKLTSKSEEVQELQKYIEFWEPLNFVTRDEVKKIVQKMMEEKFS
ncbi:hypothetical protein KY308_03275 [Candidatus Woesearchaeota archaeon]|nr:hypothetical protein [Candidatus Woesearchaeota archaeon]